MPVPAGRQVGYDRPHFNRRFLLMQQQRPNAAPSAGFNFVLAAVLGFIGVFDLVLGLRGDGPGVFITGLALTIYAATLLRDALHIKKTGTPAFTRKRMNTIGLACLALYFFGIMVKRVPELAAFFS
jgi:hypothetical protein